MPLTATFRGIQSYPLLPDGPKSSLLWALFWDGGSIEGGILEACYLHIMTVFQKTVFTTDIYTYLSICLSFYLPIHLYTSTYIYICIYMYKYVGAPPHGTFEALQRGRALSGCWRRPANEALLAAAFWAGGCPDILEMSSSQWIVGQSSGWTYASI